MTQSKRNKIIIGGLLAVVLLMVVGYAAFSTALNVNSTSNIASNWSVKITNISVEEKSSGATDTTQPTYDNTNGLSATFNTSFAKPGDYETYKIEITNSGDFNAKLASIVEPTSTNPDISFYVNKDQTNTDIDGALAQNGVLNKSGETGNVGYVYVTILYRSYEGQTSPTDANRTGTATIKFNFEQTDENAVVTPTQPSLPQPAVYAYHTAKKKRGESTLTETEYKTDYTQLDSYKAGRTCFLGYDLGETGVIQQAYACQKFSFIDEPVCMKFGESYNANQSILESLQPTFASNSGSCTLNDSPSNCIVGELTIFAYSDGIVFARDGSGLSASCSVDRSGAYCDEW